ncbi:helix-turn-helix domain-containing protein [Nocardia terpenica]|uniref:Helix-turn-helix domain-containing protein n=1 Tax=Nocardia terpenica TaxID=455432 RepID=A0A161Z1V6_9NOCA|nr:helix-turn-helix domain-containing protein [Nocardia terpenica]KZM72284.1 hypothetical protein AWN90_37040 [Nocardia terpenica]NQE86570.1 helix-turn-helix domain-containing protein [Nocardia terpenica]
MPKTSYNVEEAAAEFGLKPRDLYDAMKAYELAYHPVGRKKIILHDEMVRWLRSHQPGKPKAAA